MRVGQPGRLRQGPHRALHHPRRLDAGDSAGKTLVDATSGNTGIAYALLGAALGVPVKLVVPGSASEERKRALAAYGAAVLFSDPYDGSDGAIRLGRQWPPIADRYFYADQYRNPGQPAGAHRTTGPEIWEQSRGRVTHFVAGLGTCGTVVGTGRYLHERRPDMHVVAVEPDHGLHGMEGLKHLATSIVPEVYDRKAHDEKVTVSTGDAGTSPAPRCWNRTGSWSVTPRGPRWWRRVAWPIASRKA